jgi:capsid protein
MSARRTWADLERQAINDPLISAAVMMVRVGEMSREDALIAATLGLAEVNRQLVEENIKLRDRGAV